MSLAGAMEKLSAYAKLSGALISTSEPTENVGALPFSVVYETSAETNLLSAGMADDLVEISVEFHASRVLLPKAISDAQQWKDNFLAYIIADPTLSNTVDTITEIRRVFGKLEWGNEIHIGYRFLIKVKIQVHT